MSKIRLISIDLDGTLLLDHYRVSKENIAAIQYAKNKGVYVGINTGRLYESTKIFSDRVGANAPIIACNGAIIKQDNNTIFSSYMSLEKLLRIKKISSDNNMPFMIFTPKNYILYGDYEKDSVVSTWCDEARELIRIGYKHVSDFNELMEITNGEILKINFTIIDDTKKQMIIN